MVISALSRRDVSRVCDRLRRVRDSLRPASARGEPFFEPLETVWSADDRLLYASPSVEQRLGWEIGWLYRHAPDFSLYHPQDLERVYAHFYHSLMGRAEHDVEHRMLHADRTGYVRLSEEMIPGRRSRDGRVLDVHIKTYDVTALRAREIDFAVQCLGLFHPRSDAESLEELGVPAMLATLLPPAPHRTGARVIPFPFRLEQNPVAPAMLPALSMDFPRRPSRRRR